MRIGVLCSGGDAPGMNCCIRGVVRKAVSEGHEVVGIMHGYQGILDENFYINREGKATMPIRSVSGLSSRGGTILYSSRCDAFTTDEGRKKAAENLDKHNIDALVAIGGNGTLRGALDFTKVWDGQIIGCPATIDNDLKGTDITIGFDTAVDTAVNALDKLRDTATSHERMFYVEVMGRESGYLALCAAIAAGAEIVCIPEFIDSYEAIYNRLLELKRRKKDSILAVVAEGDELGGALDIQKGVRAIGPEPFPSRVIILGHLIRGGIPCYIDRLFAASMGVGAVEAILKGETGKMVGIVHGDRVLTPFEEVICDRKEIRKSLLDLLETMSK